VSVVAADRRQIEADRTGPPVVGHRSSAILTIARFTLQEAVSRRLILSGAILSLVFLGLFALGVSFLYGLVQRDSAPSLALRNAVFASTMTLLGLYAVNFLAGFLALFLSVGAVSGEVDSGTLHAVLARPIGRADFVLGRWLAYAGLISVYVGLMTGLLLALARLIAGYEATDAPRAVGLMALGSVLLVTVSLLGSTLLSTLANGVVVFSLYGLAWLAGVVEFIGGAVENAAMVNLGIAVSLLVPSDAIWRGASYYIQSPVALSALGAAGPGIPFAGTTPPTSSLLAWAAAYIIVVLAAAVGAFARRDL
jgi:Cu-processing system permease protein